MRQILFVKYNRTRAAQFQLKTEIVREDEVLTVEKTALTEAGEAHIRSFGEKYEKIRDLNPAIRFLKPEWKKDKKTVFSPLKRRLSQRLAKRISAPSEKNMRRSGN